MLTLSTWRIRLDVNGVNIKEGYDEGMSYQLYQLEIPENPAAVIFVNGLLARDRRGWWWMWRNLRLLRRATVEAKGCVQAKAGICSLKEAIVVSYWSEENSLKKFFQSEPHRQMMQFVRKHPQSLCLYNETYKPLGSGKYIHEPQGMALIYGQAWQNQLK
jgi:hypothetical protein